MHFFVTQKYNLEGLTASDEQISDLRREYNKIEENVIHRIRNSRFWLGRELWTKQFAYLDSIRVLKEKIEENREVTVLLFRYEEIRSSDNQEEIKERAEIEERIHNMGTSEDRFMKMKEIADAAESAFLDIDDNLKLLTRGSALGWRFMVKNEMGALRSKAIKRASPR